MLQHGISLVREAMTAQVSRNIKFRKLKARNIKFRNCKVSSRDHYTCIPILAPPIII